MVTFVKTRSKLTTTGGMSNTCLFVTTRLQISSKEYVFYGGIHFSVKKHATFTSEVETRAEKLFYPLLVLTVTNSANSDKLKGVEFGISNIAN